MIHAERCPRPRSQQGLVLLALLAILLAVVLYVVVGHLDATALKLRQDETTARALAQAKDALLAYAITYREAHPGEVYGYLPCPDVTGNGSGDTTATYCGGAGESTVGLLPFKQLGLTDLRDGAGECLWYAVSGSYKAALNKPTPMNWDSQGQMEILAPDDTSLAKPDDTQGGIAAIVFAVGPPLAARRIAGTDLPAQIRVSADTVCGRKGEQYTEFIDYPHGFPSVTSSLSIRSGPRRDENDSDSLPDSGINDRIIWITPREIHDRIKKRNDHGKFMGDGIDAIKKALELNALPAPATGNNLPEAAPPGADTFYPNWKDHFRYFRCEPADSDCYSVAGEGCNGLLLFGGASATGNPRQSTARSDADYFDLTTNVEVAAIFAGTGFVFSGSSSYDGSTDLSRATDLGLCLKKEASP